MIILKLILVSSNQSYSLTVAHTTTVLILTTTYTLPISQMSYVIATILVQYHHSMNQLMIVP
jgi:hypothetical protein